MKVYVASRWSPEDIVRVRAMYALLEAYGHTVTHDWTHEDDVLKYGDAGEQQAYLMRCAVDDVRGVQTADAVIFLEPIDNQRTRGAYFEAGMGYGLGKPLIVVGAEPGTLGMPGSCIFFTMPDVIKVKTPEEAVAALTALNVRHEDSGCKAGRCCG